MPQPIHVLSVHWRSDKWIDLQSRFVRDNLGEHDVNVVLALSPDLQSATTPHRSITVSGRHAANLDTLAATVRSDVNGSDILVFLDGDALPLCDAPTLRQLLENVNLAAARRMENSGDRQPHPLFCAVSADYWYSNECTWTEGPTTDSPTARCDVGGELRVQLAKTETAWLPLDRSNRQNLHPLWYGIYGDVVYHHGAAFREPWSSLDRSRAYGDSRLGRWLGPLDEVASKVPGIGRASRRGRIQRSNRAEAAVHSERFFRDPDTFIEDLR